jgi:hypothetical protein
VPDITPKIKNDALRNFFYEQEKKCIKEAYARCTNIMLNSIFLAAKEKQLLRHTWKWHYAMKQTSSAVGRSFGSKASNLSNSRSAKGSAFGNFCSNGTSCFFLMLVKYLLAFSLRTCKQKKFIVQA